MTRTGDTSDKPVQPSLQELLADYLSRQTAAHGAGLGPAAVGGEVEPFEAVPAQPVDPRLAWDEARAVLRFFGSGNEGRDCKAPAEWPGLVAGREPAAALAFCVGNFPQLVRALHPLLHAANLEALREAPGRPITVSLLFDEVRRGQEQPFPQVLVTLGALRLARQFDEAEALLQRRRGQVPAEWAAAWANEEAALAWHRGRAEEAAARWQPQPESVPVLFNRGMAALFLGRRAEARAALRQATAQLPEDGGWHHLGRLYLALAEMPR
jgi:tetratricopeptide (TPR) repeat protein